MPGATSNPEANERRSRSKNAVTFQHIFQGIGSYLAYNGKRLRFPLSIDSRSERSYFYGYVNLVVSALLSAAIVARLGYAFQNTYDFLRDISILPILDFQMNVWEWFWKAAVFFFSYYLLYPALTFLFRKATLLRPLSFHTGVTRFAGMNAAMYLLLWVAFLMSLVAPLALAFFIIFFLLIHALSYTAAFVTSLHQPPLEGREEKVLYQSYIGIALHAIVIMAVFYLLLKV